MPVLEDRRSWNRKIVISYWYVIGLSILSSSAGTAITYFTRPEFFIHDLLHYTLLPAILLIGVNLLSVLAVKHSCRCSDYILILTGALIPAVLIYTLAVLPGIQHILYLPILVSALYFERMKVVYACIQSAALFLLLYAIQPVLRASVDLNSLILTLSLFVCCALLTMAIMSRGRRLTERLEVTMAERQELLVRNVLMDRLSKTDALTELYNHKTFHEYLDELISQQKYGCIPMQLAVIDIDNFKRINDTWGHWVGDLVLVQVAACLRECLTSDDFASRYGGEEFAVVFMEHHGETAAMRAEEIRRRIAQITLHELEGSRVTVSIGLRPYIQRMTKEQWFKEADACLYTAKQTGKNKVVTALTDKEAAL